MAFVLKKTKDKVKSIYKTLYIPQDTAEKVERLAIENETSFNNVVVSMIDSFLRSENDENNM